MTFNSVLYSSDSPGESTPTLSKEYLEYQARPRSSKRRKKLWELPTKILCSVVGTCATIEELRTIAEHDNSSTWQNFNDYDLHKAFVNLASDKDSKITRGLQKRLDRKFSGIIKEIGNFPEQILSGVWEKAIDSGDIAGAFWTLVSHPSLTTDLLDKIYGDVHMLSHLSGASLRTDVKNNGALKEKIDKISKELDNLRSERNHQSISLGKKINVLNQKLKQTLEENRRLKNQFREYKKKTEVGGYKKEDFIRVTNDLAMARLNNERFQVKLTRANQEISSLKSETDHIRAELSKSKKEQLSLETLIQRILENSNESNDTPSAVSRLDLKSCQVLYVGGLGGLSAQFRAIVEQSNGLFRYHDGGMEDNKNTLSSAIAKADVVFCPWNCISHNAIKKIKRQCARESKKVHYLHRASISAFVDGLLKTFS